MARRRSPHAAPQRSPLADYLQKILTARVYDVAVESPLEPAPQPVGAGSATRCCSSARTAAGVQLQAARRLQQDGAPDAASSCSAA